MANIAIIMAIGCYRKCLFQWYQTEQSTGTHPVTVAKWMKDLTSKLVIVKLRNPWIQIGIEQDITEREK